jgi:hypothetical protein
MKIEVYPDLDDEPIVYSDIKIWDFYYRGTVLRIDVTDEETVWFNMRDIKVFKVFT